MSPHGPHPLAPSLSGRGSKKLNDSELDKEAAYRAMASQAMVQIARDLRQRQTPPETILWEALRNRRLANLKFRRQHPIANTTFVADFLCYEYSLVIELDGDIHTIQETEDLQRQQAIEDAGYRVIRFTNDQILDRFEDVLITILSACRFPPPLNEGEGAGG